MSITLQSYKFLLHVLSFTVPSHYSTIRDVICDRWISSSTLLFGMLGHVLWETLNISFVRREKFTSYYSSQTKLLLSLKVILRWISRNYYVHVILQELAHLKSVHISQPYERLMQFFLQEITFLDCLLNRKYRAEHTFSSHHFCF